uniref:Uncharacterized protein n=1 Tax=Triticum urartu TaxID=4572 RepID=A0A8R7PSL6_TRIUA
HPTLSSCLFCFLPPPRICIPPPPPPSSAAASHPPPPPPSSAAASHPLLLPLLLPSSSPDLHPIRGVKMVAAEHGVGDSGWTRWSTGEERPQSIHPATPPEPRRLQWRCHSLSLSLSLMPLFPSLIHRHSPVHLTESSQW